MDTSAPPFAIENIARYRESATKCPVLKSAHVPAMGFALGLLVSRGPYRTWLPSFCTSQNSHKGTLSIDRRMTSGES